MANEKIIELSSDNFQQEIQGQGPILVDFWAEWCGPCRMVGPVLEELADEMDGKVRIGKLNVDENQELSMQYQVQSIPTFLLFKDGEVADRMMGAMPKAAFEKFIERNVGAAPAADVATA
ncbi:MAG: thioredoxin [Acidobacteriota bacterium]